MAGKYQRGFDGPDQDEGSTSPFQEPEPASGVSGRGADTENGDVDASAASPSAPSTGPQSPAGSAFSMFKEEIGKAADLWRSVQEKGGGANGSVQAKKPQSRLVQLRQQQHHSSNNTTNGAPEHHSLAEPPEHHSAEKPESSTQAPTHKDSGLPPPHPTLPHAGPTAVYPNPGLPPHNSALLGAGGPAGHRSKLSVDLEEMEQRSDMERRRQEQMDGAAQFDKFEDVNELLLTPGAARVGTTVMDVEQQQPMQHITPRYSPHRNRRTWDNNSVLVHIRESVTDLASDAQHALTRLWARGSSCGMWCTQETAFRGGLIILGALVAVAIVLMAVFLSQGTSKPSSDDGVLRINEVQILGSRQSYHVAPHPAILQWLSTTQYMAMVQRLNFSHPPIYDQLQAGYRYIQLDVYYDPGRGLFQKPAVLQFVEESIDMPQTLTMPGFKVLNIPDLDFNTTCVTLADCLREVTRFSRQHPRHLPIAVHIEFKSKKARLDNLLPYAVNPRNPDMQALKDMEAEILRVIDKAQLITPDTVRGSYPTLLEAVQQGASQGQPAWPRLQDAAGKILILLSSKEAIAEYSRSDHSLEGRLMFTAHHAVSKRDLPFSPDMAVVVMESFDHTASELVAQGHLVISPLNSIKTPLDAFLWDNSLRAGCQFIALKDLPNDPTLPHSVAPFPPPAPPGERATLGGLVVPSLLEVAGSGVEARCSATLDPTSCSQDQWKALSEPVPDSTA